MKPSSQVTDMDFRIIPSAIPLQSPSPDKRNANNITPTVSPNAIEIKKNISPLRVNQQNQKVVKQPPTELKYMTHSPGVDYSSALRQKDDVIRNMRNIINLLTSNSRQGKRYEDNEENDLKQEVKILTIENQKLVSIIEKMSKQQSQDESVRKTESYEKELSELMETMKITQTEYEQQLKELKRLYKSLNNHCKSIESEKVELETENKKLLKILKDRNEGEKKITEKSRLSDSGQIDSQKGSKKEEKITLQKIKRQYSENIKILKEGTTTEIEQSFDTMKITMEGANSKINALNNRLESLEKMTWERYKKNYPDADREESPLPKQYKSQIYIEEGPQSSNERKSKDEFSQILETSRINNEQLEEQLTALKSELAVTKSELAQIRFKYEKLCLDTSQVSYSQRIPSEKQEFEKHYKKMAENLESKSKQIQRLAGEIKSFHESNLEVSRRESQWIAQLNNKDNALKRLQEHRQRQLAEIKFDTKEKLKMLVKNYEKEIEMLRKEVSGKNIFLIEASETLILEKSESTKKMQQINSTFKSLQEQVQKLESALSEKDTNFQSAEQQWKMQKEHLQRQIAELEVKVEQSQKNQNVARTKREFVEQQIVLQMVEINQLRAQVVELKGRDEKNGALINQLSEGNEQLNSQLSNKTAHNRQSEELISRLNSEMIKIKQTLLQLEQTDLLKQIDEVKELIEKHELESLAESEINQLNFQEDENVEKELEVSNLRKQIQKLRRVIIEKDEKSVELQSGLAYYKQIWEETKARLKEQQDLTDDLLSRIEQMEKELAKQKRENKLIMDRQGEENILDKIAELRASEESRRQKIQQLIKSELDQ